MQMGGTDRRGRDLESSVAEGVFCRALVTLVGQVEVKGVSDKVEDRVPVGALVHGGSRKKEKVELKPEMKPWSIMLLQRATHGYLIGRADHFIPTLFLAV